MMNAMTPWVRRLIFANVGIFLLTSWNPTLTSPFVLVPALILVRPWTLLSYMFLHAGFMHVFFNMIGLYFFGSQVEERLGGRRFLGLYLTSGLGGALLSIATPYAHIVGASGAVFGVMLAFARYWPHATIVMWFFPMEARVAVVMMAALSIFGGFGGTQPGVAHFAHLGGFAGGYLFLRIAEARSPAAKFRAQVAPPPPPRWNPDGNLERWRRVDAAALHPVNREEYERVMTKIEAGGTGGLTPGEREFLDRFSASRT
jgi:membrane associated rhomboid family serine protease